jgi:hypothetical protein
MRIALALFASMYLVGCEGLRGQDACLDAGGRWLEDEEACEGAEGHYKGKRYVPPSPTQNGGATPPQMPSSAAGDAKDDEKTDEDAVTDDDNEK